ncbi:hypothetical protein ACIBQ1_16920 [Nonomuraea sp. NPDC050153]
MMSMMPSFLTRFRHPAQVVAAETELSYGDVVLVSGRTEQVERFAELP